MDPPGPGEANHVTNKGLTGKFKTWIYQHSILPKTLWPLLVYQFPLSTIEGSERRISSPKASPSNMNKLTLLISRLKRSSKLASKHQITFIRAWEHPNSQQKAQVGLLGGSAVLADERGLGESTQIPTRHYRDKPQARHCAVFRKIQTGGHVRANGWHAQCMPIEVGSRGSAGRSREAVGFA